MTFGQSQSNFLVNSSAAVAQIVQTRLLLFLGEWFLDTNDGTDWDGSVLGKYTAGLYDKVIQARILGTQGVTGIVTGTYSSSYNSALRSLTISCTVETQYSEPADVEVNLNVGQ
jgi:hypothetical protein